MGIYGCPARIVYLGTLVAAVMVVVVNVRADVHALRLDESHDGIVMREEVGFAEAELIVEYVEELALNSANVTFAEDTGAECPVNVL